jgi:hypothetical protein
MRKIAEEIEEDIFKLVKASSIASEIAGIYRNGTRPFDSKAEDAVINFLTGIDGQKQAGIVNINVYVPNIDNGNQLLVKNISRCSEIGVLLNEFKESLMGSRINTERNGYWFKPNGDLIRTYEEKDINQHYVNLRLEFEYLTN